MMDQISIQNQINVLLKKRKISKNAITIQLFYYFLSMLVL